LASHVVQAAPAVPHAVGDGVVHTPLAQQPFGHEVPSQTQAPVTQRWPLAHGFFVPHLHAPPLQVSAVMPQFMHAPPVVPQALDDGVVQAPVLLQQPVGHEVPSQVQALFAHREPVAQATQVAPAVPQAVLAVPATHWLFWQQPVAHDVALHTHAPATQA
jgi:hypothetical protein